MAKAYSGLSSSGSASDRDYDAGGSGLLGSRTHDTIEEWNKFFGVKYNHGDYWDGFDPDESYGTFGDWHADATNAELKAAETYTGSWYREINKYLRSGTLDQASGFIKDTVKNLDSGIQKFYLKEAITVWRGGSNKLIGGAQTVEDINKMVGAVVIDRGITSTAVTKGASWISDEKMGYEIVYPKGRGRGVFVDPISDNHGEQEFMAARNTRYEVLGGYRDDDGRVICRLKAIYGKKGKK